MNTFLTIENASAAPLASLPVVSAAEFRDTMKQALCQDGMRVASFFAMPEENGDHRLTAVLCGETNNLLHLLSFRAGRRYPALTPDLPQFHWFEREIAEQYGIIPEGHPWLKPIRFHRTLDNAPDAWGRTGAPVIGVTDYFRMQGTAAHEVAVGPVHAGVIEPGHFRFQCMGEDVYSLEIELGYQHRGIEKMLIGGPDRKTQHFMETAAGDSSIASATTYARIMEALSGSTVPERAHAIRALALELERIANHTGDCGALAGDVAFLPTASYCGRIRGEYLNMTAELCGNRFGRNLVIPGGVRFDVTPAMAEKLLAWMDRIRPELFNALDLFFDTPSVLDRFENTGTVSREDARNIGLVGVAGRASGLELDTRRSLPDGGWKLRPLPPAEPAAARNGDVLSRAAVRYQEIRSSERYVRDWLTALPDGSCYEAPAEELAKDSIAVAVTEAWRGELCHTAVTGKDGRFRRYKIVDPSFHNWFG
ncbi:MAG: NADH-quinone oxidoreductase subunit C, partial [Lentisphaeria bacterium]|nr:NADH-quinone oxidoreductase subunit C [Lentisphaeria bacterium]